MLLLGLAALVHSWHAMQKQSPASEPPQGAESAVGGPSSDTPRDFVLLQLGTWRRDQFLLSKNTGRIWHKVCAGEVTKDGFDCDGLDVWTEYYVDGLTPVDAGARYEYEAAIKEMAEKERSHHAPPVRKTPKLP